MRGAYRARQASVALRNCLSPGAVVLLYHRVTQLDSDPFQVAITPAHFAEHLQVICRLAGPVRLRDLTGAAAIHQGFRGKVALTFDDGYADNLLEAKPLLEEVHVPATVFVTSGFVGEEREFWWDEVEQIASRIGGDPRAIRAQMRVLPEDRRERNLEQLRAIAGWPPARPTHRSLTAAEVGNLASGGLIEIGAHTITHVDLAHLSPSRQGEEIVGAKRTLEELSGTNVTSFSYPFGGYDDFSRETVALVRSSGYSRACANYPGTVWRFGDPFRIPRFVVRDWDGNEFERRLRGWQQGRHVSRED